MLGLSSIYTAELRGSLLVLLVADIMTITLTLKIGVFLYFIILVQTYVFSKPARRAYQQYRFFKELSNTTKIHEHDFITFGVEEKPSLICSTCGLFYCETCGKSVKEMISDSVDDL